MNKSILTVSLALLFFAPAVVQAKSSSECAMAKYMAGHALTVIKGGATLNQALGMFENNAPNAKIIKEIYSRKDHLAQIRDAEMIGVNMCMRDTSSV